MKTNELYLLKEKCSGCYGCYNSCPTKAISMDYDLDGYIYPIINENKCTDCKKCIKVCAYKKNENRNSVKKALVAVVNDKSMLMESASGGVFSCIARRILENKGVVYGCALIQEDNTLKAKHIRITEHKELNLLQGSKYVHSQIGETYTQLKKDLLENKVVLFSGTPCQVDGLLGFLNYQEYSNLVTIDLICHGVPGDRMFEDYIRFVEKKNRINITDFKFRNKDRGWGLNAKVYYERGNKFRAKLLSSKHSSYYKLFLESLSYRKNCYYCPYANDRRVADLTLGDYWGIVSEHPEHLKDYDIKNGVSCLLINTIKGKDTIDRYANDLFIKESHLEKVKKHNKQLKNPSEFPKEREEILDIYRSKGYPGIEKWYKKNCGHKYYLYTIWDLLPYNMRTFIKKFV